MALHAILTMIVSLSCICSLVHGQSRVNVLSCSSSPCPRLHLCVPLSDSYKCICIDPICFPRAEATTRLSTVSNEGKISVKFAYGLIKFINSQYNFSNRNKIGRPLFIQSLLYWLQMCLIYSLL
jgi:hypothetical protein